MRRRTNVEVIGLSFLDLVCCAFGGVIILFVLSDKVSGLPSPYNSSLRFINVAVQDGLPATVGISFTIDGEDIECWEKICNMPQGINLNMEPGETVVAIYREGDVEPHFKFGILDVPDSLVYKKENITLCIDYIGERSKYVTKYSEYYRGVFDVASEVGCE